MLFRTMQRFNLNLEGESSVSRTLHRTIKLKEILQDLNPSEPCEIIYIDDSGELPNALALNVSKGKGCILVGREIYDSCTETELSFVVAHELAHLELGHVLNAESEFSSEADIEENISIEIKRNRPANKCQRWWIMLRDWVMVSHEKWLQRKALLESRCHEYEADELAFKLLEMRGIDSSGAVSFLRKLRRSEYPIGICSINAENEIRLQNSHPFAYERISNLEITIGDKDGEDTAVESKLDKKLFNENDFIKKLIFLKMERSLSENKKRVRYEN